MRKLRALARHAVAVLGLLLLGVALLEAVLQLGAWSLRATGREIPSGWIGDRRRILCVGDSHTYGLYLPREEAYPQQLEALWNGRAGSELVEVLNLGFPGVNSSRLRSDYRRMIETLGPEIVLILVGANNYWTHAVPITAADEAEEGSALRFLREHSVAYRLSYAVARVLDTRRLEVEFGSEEEPDERRGIARYGEAIFSLGWRRREIEADLPWPEFLQRSKETREALARDVRALVEVTRRARAEPYLLTYASRFEVYGAANNVLRAVADDTGVPLIDLAEVFTPLCAEWECPDLMFPDNHPNAKGYGIVAEAILCELEPGHCRRE